MTTNQAINKKKKRNKSLLITWASRLVSFFSALFLKSWIGRGIMNSGKVFENSYIRKLFVVKQRSLRKENSFIKSLAVVFENGFVSRFGRSLANLMASLAVNVYGMFFMSFGLCTVITQFVAIYVVPSSLANPQMGLLTGAICVVCSVPFLLSSKSVIQIFSGGKIARKITVKLFCIPEEKLWNPKKVGGADFMLLTAFMGIAAGAITYFISPIQIVAAFFIFVSVVLIFSYPESGIILSCILIPFLQYLNHVDLVMFALVTLTAVSYVIKLLRGKRTFRTSSAGVMVMLFGVAMIIAGIFSPGGKSALLHSIYNVIIIWGAFFLGGNLTRNDNVRKICIKILTAALIVIAFLQFFNLYYSHLYASVEQSFETDYRYIVLNSKLGVENNLKIPGLWAAMLSPLLISECFKAKRIYGAVGVILCFVPVVLSIAYFGTLEIMIALLIGVALYLILHSPKSIPNILIIALCAALIFMLVPVVASQLGVHNLITFGEIIENIFPGSDELSAYRSHIENDTLKMLLDGNIFGIGSGVYAYQTALSPYVTPVSANAQMPGTSYMQIFCESGIIGLFIFAIFSVLLLKSGIKYVIKPNDREYKTLMLGLICGYITALILASASCIFEDIQMRYLFWLYAGLISSQIFSGEAKENLSRSSMKDSSNEIDLIERV